MLAMALPPSAPTFEELRIDIKSKSEILDVAVLQNLQSMLA
jgi:hypothetical protein